LGISTLSATEGSTTSIFWKRRASAVLLEHAAEFLERRRADARNSVGEHGLDQVRRVHGATTGRAGADDGVDLVDEQDRMRLLLELRDHRLQAFFKITAILRARGEPRSSA
jgi:hypothetical protein